MESLFMAAVDALDRSATLLTMKTFWIACGVVIFLLCLYYRRRKKVERVPEDKHLSPSPSNVISKSLWLARESAREVAQALEVRSTNVRRAYEGALKADILARTARDISPNMDDLSKSLGVDFFEYLAYTSSVLSDVESAISIRCNPPRDSR